jgi:glycerol-3-phosphate acyltransferase PlsY
MLKGTAAVLIAKYYGMELGLFAGFGAFLGHLFPAWLGFKGGKGVATYLGVLIGLVWQAALIFAAVWLLMAVLFRYSSLAALSAAVIVPIALWFLATPAIAGMFALMSIILIYKHRTNISRLMAGTEGRIGAKG